MESFRKVTGIAAPDDAHQHRHRPDHPHALPRRHRREGLRQAPLPSLSLPGRRRAPTRSSSSTSRPTTAEVLLADRNFGCGSSRERAPKALREFGFRAVIAPSFGGIFFNNCYRNGIVPVELPIEDVRAIAGEVEASGGAAQVTVDLEAQTVTSPSGGGLLVHRARHAARRCCSRAWTRSRSRSRDAGRSMAFARATARAAPGPIEAYFAALENCPRRPIGRWKGRARPRRTRPP